MAAKTSVWTVILAADALAQGFPLQAQNFPTPREHNPTSRDRPRGKRPPNQTYSVYLRHADGTLYAAALTRGTNYWHFNADRRPVWQYDYSNDYTVYRWNPDARHWNHLPTTDGAGPSCLLGRRYDTEYGRTGIDENISEEECQKQLTTSFKNHLNTYLKKLEKEGASRIVCICGELSAREAEGTFPTYSIPRPVGIRPSTGDAYGEDKQTLWVVAAVGNMRHYKSAVYHVWDQFAGAGRRTIHSVWVWYAGEDDWQEVESLRGREVAYGTMQKHLEPEYRRWVEAVGY